MSAFVWAVVSVAVLTPVMRRLAAAVGAVDRPGPRSVHQRPVPLLGGVALYLAFAVAVLAHFGWGDPELRGLLLGGALIVAIGVLDDTAELWGRRLRWLRDAEVRGLHPLAKLLVEVGGAVVLWLYGVRIDYVHVLIGPTSFGPVASLLLTVLWVVALTNAMNLIDGLDGLTAGVTAIASLVMWIIAVRQGTMPEAAALAAVLFGVSVGFLPWNFYPARIFMGDAGALFVGYALASVAIIGPIKAPTAMSLEVPILALGFPVVDTLVAIVRRLRLRRPVAQADRGHLHHRLLDLGLSQRGAVVLLYVVSGWLGVGALAVSDSGAVLGFGIVLFIVLSGVAVLRLIRSVGRVHSRAISTPVHQERWYGA